MKHTTISISIFVILTIFSFLPVEKAEEKTISLFEQLKSKQFEERQVAAEMIVKQREQAIHQAELIIKELIHNEDRKGTVETAIILLGKLQSQQSIPLLVEYLTFEVFYKNLKRPQLIEDRFPSVQALINIGIPSIDPLLEKVTFTIDNKVISCAAKVMSEVLGKESALDYINKRIKNESDDLKKKRLSNLLNAISGN